MPEDVKRKSALISKIAAWRCMPLLSIDPDSGHEITAIAERPTREPKSEHSHGDRYKNSELLQLMVMCCVVVFRMDKQ